MSLRVTFFAKVTDASLLDTVGFYASDVGALEDRGHRVRKVISYSGLATKAECYFVWWWTWALPVVLLARFRRKPVFITGVFNFDSGDAGVPGYGNRPFWQRAAVLLSARLATANLFLSKQEYASVPRRLRLKRCAYFPPIVAKEPWGSEPADVSHLTLGQPYIFNLAWSGPANLHRKCVYELIDAFETVADETGDINLILAGNMGEAATDLQTRVATSRHEARIKYLGTVPDSTKWALMRQATIFASPSRFEGFGLAIAEAASVGTPIVTSRVGEVQEVLGPESALYCDGSNPRSIADAIRECLKNPASAQSRSAIAARSIARFTAEEKARRLTQLGL